MKTLSGMLSETVVAGITATLGRRKGKKDAPRCLNCGAELIGKRVFWCGAKCGRNAHYVRFSVRDILKREMKGAA